MVDPLLCFITHRISLAKVGLPVRGTWYSSTSYSSYRALVLLLYQVSYTTSSFGQF